MIQPYGMPSPLICAAQTMVKELKTCSFSAPVTHVYNPLEYAWETHREYLERYGSGQKRVLMLGMNPGPWGMAQTGVPFGEIELVRDWMRISGAVKKPRDEHPKRPIEGFACQRSEVSGRRLWGLFAERFESAEVFFQEHFVVNFCPLVWMAESGKNITPDTLPKHESAPVDEICQRHLKVVIEQLEPEFLIGVGAFALKQLTATKKRYFAPQTFQLGKILHPSPASPIANRGWAPAAQKQLEEQGVW